MRIILTICLLILCSTLRASDLPKLTLNVYYSEPSDTLFLDKVRKSNETCCKYTFVTIKSAQSKIEVCAKEESLGTIYGYPTEKFLLDIYDRYFK